MVGRSTRSGVGENEDLPGAFVVIVTVDVTVAAVDVAMTTLGVTVTVAGASPNSPWAAGVSRFAIWLRLTLGWTVAVFPVGHGSVEVEVERTADQPKKVGPKL